MQISFALAGVGAQKAQEPVQSLGASGQKVVWDGLQGAKRSHSWGYGEAWQRQQAAQIHFLASRAEALNRL